MAPRRIVAEPTGINQAFALRRLVGIAFLLAILTPKMGNGEFSYEGWAVGGFKY
jgi:hypothetical protein